MPKTDQKVLEAVRRYDAKKNGYAPADGWIPYPNNGACEICGQQTDLRLDHNHKTGVLRGYLCPKCNMGLGMFAEKIENLQRAIDYLMEANHGTSDYASR